MPSKVKIVLLTFLLMSCVIGALAALQLHNLVTASFQSSVRLAELAAQQTKAVLLLRLDEYWRAAAEPPRDDSARRRLWAEGVASDEALAAFLAGSVAQGASLVEISIAGEGHRVLRSSNPSREAGALQDYPSLQTALEMNSWTLAQRILSATSDYEVRIPIGVLGDPRPVFVIQVLASTVLLRAALGPNLQTLAFVSAVSLAASLLAAWGLAGLISRNLGRIAEGIDRILRGDAEPDSQQRSRTPEFALVESKLSLLGAHVRDTARIAADFRSHVSGILERLEEGILLFDGDRRLILTGGAAERLLGLSAMSLPAPLEALLNRAFESGDSFLEQRVEWRREDAPAQLLVSVHCFREAAGARPSSVLIRLRDTESRRDLESRMSLLSRLDAINRLTGSVAHEIKNPLNAIAARLALIESMVEGSSEAEQEIRLIGEEIERLDRVVRTFLDFTRPVELHRSEVDLAGTAVEVGEWIRPDASRRNVRVAMRVPGTPVLVWGDPDLLRQAIMNLAVNAIEATPDGGEVCVEVAETGQECRLTVADTGRGIPAEYRDKIFQLYFTTKSGGSGIGLAMVYRAVQLHGGRLELTSETGQGTRFQICFPKLAVENA